MCNLYSELVGAAAIVAMAKAMNSGINFPPLPGVYPDKPAPIVRNGPNGRELAMARWGLPSPDKHVATLNYNKGTTNVRRPEIKHWQQWMGVENRCVVPFTSFAEPTTIDGKTTNAWFALSEDEPLAFFAGAWTPWTGVRMVKEGQVTCDVFAFLTTDANAEVFEHHPKAMPVILRTPEEIDRWMTIPNAEIPDMQQTLPDGSLKIISFSREHPRTAEFKEPKAKAEAIPKAQPEQGSLF
ncbi:MULTISPECIES: SOS response-associated peptidase family protein [Asticcacaulis]|uniref:SOS response-associated peptidase family protein n=1 Tax=Asticcacaulis TaxID=76890 RepID=UPI001AE8ADC0|nr:MULTISPECIES: SOS response-associated peptidase family protein [Asticcacaulis]MBP2159562.1 putative SOS response-associated peptidase YedK [Asticcacaulis solisilvae]MDR6800611.1 putative SOS response-associated peptidase YedK [Asticcacaulis sp. BE141]